MKAQVRVVAARVGHHRDVGADQRVGAQAGGRIDRGEPWRGIVGAGVGVQRHQHLAAARMGVGHAFAQLRVIEVEAGEVARVGGVAQAEVDRVGAGVDRELQGTQGTGGADEFGRTGTGHPAAFWPCAGAAY